MNKAIMIGRLTKDPELKTTHTGLPVTSFTIAVNRRFKNKETGEYEADFIDVVAWRQAAEFITKYFNKGSRIAIVGTIQSRSWEDETGNRRYRTEVVADEVYFVDSKRQADNQTEYMPANNERLPFDL